MIDDFVRICPKCKARVNTGEEGKAACPKCQTIVRFYNHTKLTLPPELPQKPGGSQDVVMLLFAVSAVFLSILGLCSFLNGSLAAVVASIVAVFAVAACIIQRFQFASENVTPQYYSQLRECSIKIRAQFVDAVNRYNNLLAIGDDRIKTYLNIAEAETNRARSHVSVIDSKIEFIANQLFDDHLKWVMTRVKPDPDDYVKRKRELKNAFDVVAKVGHPIDKAVQQEKFKELQTHFKRVTKEKKAKDRQRNLNKQLKEDEKAAKEHAAAIKKAQDQESEINRRLEKLMKDQSNLHSEELEALKQQLADAKKASERAKSMAQLTRAGYVYILSNIGTMGDNVFKVGMTRRLEPMDRVKELGDASVPFPFDVHALIECDDAPKLEKQLHRHLSKHRVNRVNLRKEFFCTNLETILEAVEALHGKIEYVADPDALEYRDTLNMSPEEAEALENELEALGVEFEEE